VVQKVFKPSISSGVPYVPADQLDPARMKIADSKTKPFIEISIDFTLTPTQFENEATLHTAQTLSKLAAKSLAFSEDMILLQGIDGNLPASVRVVNRDSADHGLIGEAVGREVAVAHLPAGGPAAYGANLMTSVREAIKQLNQNNQHGPYALILESSVYTDAFAPVVAGSATIADALNSVLTGGFYGTGALPANTGLLTSLGGEPTSVYVAQNPTIAYLQDNADGSLFRISERVQFVARERTAFVKLAFRAAAGAHTAGA